MKNQKEVYQSSFYGERSVVLVWDSYQSVLLPEKGGNLISFVDRKRDYHFLHEPTQPEMQEFDRQPYIYGIPVLLPPNRYEAGHFIWNGRSYQFPINEPSRNTHLHGFLYDIPWTLEDYGILPTETFASLTLTVDRYHAVYRYFPHNFTIRLRYSLNEDGLCQHILIRNEGSEPMPCLLGFHTAFNAPFAKNSEAADYRVKVSVGQRWRLDGKGLPTGERLELSEEERNMQNTGIFPFSEPMDYHYTASAENGLNRMELHDTKNHVKLIYDVGLSYRHWMIWNNQATPGFFCAEPQVNAVNAPNLALPDEQTGLFAIQPGDIWEETSRLYVKTDISE